MRSGKFRLFNSLDSSVARVTGKQLSMLEGSTVNCQHQVRSRSTSCTLLPEINVLLRYVLLLRVKQSR